MNHQDQATAFSKQLQRAAFYGRLDDVNALLAWGANPNISGINSDPPLVGAALNGHLAVVNTLLAHGADANLKLSNGHTALQWAAYNGHKAVYEALLPRTHQPDLNWILLSFSKLGCLDQVEDLLANGTDPNISDCLQYTSLHHAAVNGHLAVVKALLDGGADANLKECKGRTALQCAVDNGHLALYQALLPRTHQPDLNRILQSFSCMGYLDQVEALLANGADANANIKEGNGLTALSGAAASGHLAVVNALLANGTDPNIPDNHQYTALHRAAENGYLDVINALLANGADPNIPNKHKYTPLHRAVDNAYAYLDVVNTLLANGADPNLKEGRGLTALQCARSAKKTIQNFLASRQPLSLQHWGRTSIRTRLVQRLADGGQPLKPAIESLPLPTAMKQYVFNPLTL